MAIIDATSILTDEAVSLICASLPNEADPRRRQLLPKILREWSLIDLHELPSIESHAIRRERIKRVKRVGKSVCILLQSLDAIDETDRFVLASQMARMEGHAPSNSDGTEIKTLIKRIVEERDFLSRLAAAAPETWNCNRGQPRNITAYLVIRDAADIFEWVTNIRATRVVDRHSGAEIGPFWQFVAAIWPVVFGKADGGLPAAMKNWASYRKRYDERSALIANIAMRHPTWGIFER
jgi:hypothetical protein